jgi:hypothetical protein
MLPSLRELFLYFIIGIGGLLQEDLVPHGLARESQRDRDRQTERQRDRQREIRTWTKVGKANLEL